MKKKLVLVISCVFIFALLALVLIFMSIDKPILNYTEEEIKFKDEYENNNGIELAENYILKTINIESDNNVKYVNDDQILSLLSSGTNVIYFGWSDCNWCRTVVPVLVSTLKENDVDTLYYYNFKNLRTAYENDNDDKKTKIYEEILNIIGDDISSVFDENSLKNGEKKILAPTVVFVKDGEYVGLHVKSVDSQLNSTDDLNKEQINELKDIYQTLINQINSNICSNDEGC